jgi:hypothetical protein
LALITCGLLNVGPPIWAQEKPGPIYADVRYGPHERNVLDFWQAQADKPTPLVIYIHGGGFRGGNKNSLGGHKVEQFLEAGISVAAIHYRLLAQDFLPAAHHDGRRAVQFLRTKADDWNLDSKCFGAFGGSAGAQICMYLAFHDDMADPNSQSRLEQQSTRLQCVATNGGQTTMDFKWWSAHIPGYERPHRPATEYFGEISEHDRDGVIRDISAMALLSKDDPPIFMQYRMAPDAPQPSEPGQVQGWRVHHVNFGMALLKQAQELGVSVYLKHPGADVKVSSDVDFFRERLLGHNASGQ